MSRNTDQKRSSHIAQNNQCWPESQDVAELLPMFSFKENRCKEKAPIKSERDTREQSLQHSLNGQRFYVYTQSWSLAAKCATCNSQGYEY